MSNIYPSSPLANYLLSQEHFLPCQCCSEICMLYAVESQFTWVLHSPSDVIQPCQALAAGFHWTQQEAAHEFLMFKFLMPIGPTRVQPLCPHCPWGLESLVVKPMYSFVCIWVDGMGPMDMHHLARNYQSLQLERDTPSHQESLKSIPTWKAKKPEGLEAENSGTQLRWVEIPARPAAAVQECLQPQKSEAEPADHRGSDSSSIVWHAAEQSSSKSQKLQPVQFNCIPTHQLLHNSSQLPALARRGKARIPKRKHKHASPAYLAISMQDSFMYFVWWVGSVHPHRVGEHLQRDCGWWPHISRKDMLFIHACFNEERLLVCVCLLISWWIEHTQLWLGPLEL